MKTVLYFDMDNVLVDFQSGLDQVSEEVKAKYLHAVQEELKQQENVNQVQNSTGRRFCPNCGTKLNPGARFCPECGEKQ